MSSGMKPFWLWAAGSVLIVTLATILALSASGDPAPASIPGGSGGTPQPRSAIALGAAQYEVLGDGPVDRLEYTIVGDDSTARNVALPWVKSTGVEYMTLFAYRGPGPGTITCRITGSGQILASSTATGPYALCTVSAVP